MAKLSVVILTKNEEKNILDCLESLHDVDEVVIIDDYSDDRTEEIVKDKKFKNLKFYKRKLDGDFAAQRNFGIAKSTFEWILFVDADERVSNKLMSEIKDKIENEKYDGYLIKRADTIFGKRLNYGETNIKLLRLAKHNKGLWVGKVHERWDIKGNLGELTHEIMHFPHQTISEFLAEINSYSTLRARELKEQGVSVSLLDIVSYPKAKFFLNYFLKLGFLDGLSGLVVAIMMSFHSYLVRSKLWLLTKRSY